MNFPYLGEATTNIIKSDPLIGVSIGGIMNNPAILLNKDILAVGAIQVRQQNAKIARILGINPASRTTCVKPDGTVSLLLGMTSGIHGAYAKKYLRSVEANNEEPTSRLTKRLTQAYSLTSSSLLRTRRFSSLLKKMTLLSPW